MNAIREQEKNANENENTIINYAYLATCKIIMMLTINRNIWFLSIPEKTFNSSFNFLALTKSKIWQNTKVLKTMVKCLDAVIF